LIGLRDKNCLNKNPKNTDVGILVSLLVFGFYAQFVIVNQSVAKDTLNVPLSGIGNNANNIVNSKNNNDNGNNNNNNNNNNITQHFHVYYEMLINDSHSLTQNYQKEIGKWQSKQYDNKTMILITDKYLPEFQKLVNRAQALQPTTAKYLQAKDLYVKSLQSEMKSYIHFRSFLATGSKTEDDISTELLSNALKFEIKSFAAFNNRTVTDTDNSYGNGSFAPVSWND
jgi:hypothetical protein